MFNKKRINKRVRIQSKKLTIKAEIKRKISITKIKKITMIKSRLKVDLVLKGLRIFLELFSIILLILI